MGTTVSATRPRAGLRFLHARQLHRVKGAPVSQWPPEPCIVTRVTARAVYFVNTSGYRSEVAVERFESIVKEVLA